MNSIEKSLDFEKLIAEGYSVLDSEVDVIPNFTSNHEVIGKNLGNTPLAVLKQFLNDQLMDFVTNFVNERLALKLEAYKPTLDRRYVYRPTTNHEILACISITILCEHCKSLSMNTIQKQFDEVKTTIKRKYDVDLPFGIERFKALYEAVVPSKEELHQFIDLLNPIFFSLVDTSKLLHMCVDETMYETNPRMEKRQRADPFKESRNTQILQEKEKDNLWSKFVSSLGLWPIVHIEDKPHDGLYMTGLSVKSTKTNMPYLISLVPYLGES